MQASAACSSFSRFPAGLPSPTASILGIHPSMTSVYDTRIRRSVTMRQAVQALSAIERRATSEGERRSAEWVAEELHATGASQVRLSGYRAHSTWAVSLAAHSVLVLAASVAGGLMARAVAAITAVSLEADSTARGFWLRRLLPGKRHGANVEGRIPAEGRARRTVVVVAHHDAAHNGFVWHPMTVDAGRRVAARTGTTPAYMGVP